MVKLLLLLRVFLFFLVEHSISWKKKIMYVFESFCKFFFVCVCVFLCMCDIFFLGFTWFKKNMFQLRVWACVVKLNIEELCNLNLQWDLTIIVGTSFIKTQHCSHIAHLTCHVGGRWFTLAMNEDLVAHQWMELHYSKVDEI